MNLQPQRGDDKVAIPVSFDTKWETQELKVSKLYISLGISLACLAFWVVIMFLATSDDIRVWSGLILLVGVPTILRYGFIGERHWRKNFQELREHDYQYDYSLFWNIYDTSTTEPTFFFHTTGNNSLFVAFDKDVIVGKGTDSDFDHYEAISNAYNLLAKKDIICTHIDYMDNVGKDNRLIEMMDEINHSCKSEDLKNCVLDMYEYMQWYMSDTFTDYDVYCFTSKMRIDLMLDELTPVLSAMLGGNYVRYRILDRQDVRTLVSSVYDLPDFSVTRSCDNLFASRGVSSYIRIIWTEKDGKKEKVNKTRAEMREEARIQQAEKEARRANKSRRKVNNVMVQLFDEEPNSNQATSQSNPTQGTTSGYTRPTEAPRARANFNREPTQGNTVAPTTQPKEAMQITPVSQTEEQNQQNSDSFNLFDE